MNMKVKSGLIRKLRQERLWSQQQLAEACDLGLRTVQRLERDGSASLESVRALASVFELPPEDIIRSEEGFVSYRHVQRADYILIGLGVAAAIVCVAQIDSGALPPWALGLFAGSFILLAVMFHSLTIEVDADMISWHFGHGFWRRSIALNEVADFKMAQHPLWWGFGIRALTTGWLYRVSGLLAVELELESGSTIVLGTDEPTYLKSAIEDAKDDAL